MTPQDAEGFSLRLSNCKTQCFVVFKSWIFIVQFIAHVGKFL